MSDAAIIQQVLYGRTEAFNELVFRYQAALFRLAYTKLADVVLAEDVVQETFLAAFKSLHTYDSHYSFRTWLWTILLNQCRRQGQRQQKRAERELRQDNGLLAQDHSSNDPSPPSQLIRKEQAEHLSTLLCQLPAVQADALRLRFFGELKFKEIADVMDCSLSSAKGRVKTGLDKISSWLTDCAIEPDLFE
jgi:RNA polymerase sigma-70 factor (ECF subfamily)